MITCPNPSCEQPVPEDAMFCPACGTSLQAAADASDESFVGRVLNQKYRLTEHLAEGGMARVYKAQRIFFDDICAVKVIKRGLSSKEEMLKRFQREAKLTNKVARRSPYIINIYDFDVEDGVGFYYVMELLNGFPFTEVLTDPQHPPPAIKMVRHVCQMCEALSVVHDEGLVHRDIKPDNIFLHKEDEQSEEIVKLLDFGIARPTYAKATMLTNYGRVMGTPEYMSPEQCRGPTPEQYERGESHLDGRSDIYSLGVLLYQGLTGQVPFPMSEDGGPMAIHKVMAGHVMEEPRPPMEVRSDLDISPALSGVALKALAKEPAERFQSMLAFRDALLSCFPSLMSEFKGVSMVAEAAEAVTLPSVESSSEWERDKVDALAETAASTPGVPMDESLALDRTALDVQLPESILAQVQQWSEQSSGSQGQRASLHEGRAPSPPIATSRNYDRAPGAAFPSGSDLPWPSQNPNRSDNGAHTFDRPASDGFDMSKTVTEPMSPNIMQELQRQAEAAIKAENAAGAPLPFAPQTGRRKRMSDDTNPTPSPRALKRKSASGASTLTRILVFLIVVLSLALGGYFVYINL